MNEPIDPFFKMFREPADRTKWEKYLEFSQGLSEIDQIIKDQWAEAIQFLHLELGNRFLSTRENKHPVVRMITDKILRRDQDFISLVQAMKKLRNTNSNYEILKQRLLSPNKCKTEGIPFLHIAEMYLNRECEVLFYERKENERHPDIKIMFPETKESLDIEVSKVEESEERNKLDENYRIISKLFNFYPPQIPFSCKLLRYMTNEELDFVIDKIISIRSKANLEQTIVYYSDDKMKLAVAHPKEELELDSYCVQNNLRRTLLGPELNFDETERIVNYKIEKEAEQIASTSSGIIYLPVNSIYFWVMDREYIIQRFNKKMAAFSNLYGIVLYGSIIDELPPFKVSENGHFFSRKEVNQAESRYLFFVRNFSYSGDLSIGALAKIYQTFE